MGEEGGGEWMSLWQVGGDRAVAVARASFFGIFMECFLMF